MYCIARSVGRARIETTWAWVRKNAMLVSPAQLGGRGLKLCSGCGWSEAVVVSPAQLGGRGLKRGSFRLLQRISVYRPLSWAGAD